MRKRLFSILLTVLAVLGIQNVRADEPDVKRYATDESGVFYVRCDYYAATDRYVITLTGIASDAYEIWDATQEKYVENPKLKDLVFPSEIHAKFLSYNKASGGDDLENDFAYELGEGFFGSMDYRVVETITFEEGVTEIPNNFYATVSDEIMTDMWEDYEANEATVLREIKFPTSVTKIGDNAFSGHINLEKITFGSGLTTIGDNAFKAVHEYSMGGGMGLNPEEISVWHSHITELELPEWLEKIGANAFQGLSQLKNLSLVGNLTEIGVNAFANTGIENLIAGIPMLSISTESPFASCPIKKLNILCDGTAEAFVAIIPEHLMHGVTSQFDVDFIPMPGVGEKCEGYLFHESCFEGSGVKSINFLNEVEESPMYPSIDFQKNSFRNTYWFKTLDLASIDCKGNVFFSEGAFQYSGLETLTLNNRVNWIMENAFDGTRIKTLEIPQFLNPMKEDAAEPMMIGDYAFYNTQQLESIRILGNIKSSSEDNTLSVSVLERCYKLQTVELPASLEIISSRAFSESGLTSFTGGTSLKAMESYVFAGCKNLKKVDLSATTVTKLSDYLFQDCKQLEEIKFPEGLETVNGYAFQNTALKEIAVPANDVKAFAFCDMDNLEKISFTGSDFEKAVTNLLSGCKNLKVIDFGNVKEFEENCINGCPMVENLVIPAKAETINKDAFSDIAGQITTLTFNSNAMKDVEDISSSPFVYMEAALNFGKDVKNVPAFAFSGMHISNSPELRADMKFDASAFEGCTLDSLNWHYSDIDTYPFKKATAVKLAFKDLKEIKKGLFSESSIGNLYLHGVETVGESAFEKAEIVNYFLNNTLIIPASVKEIKAKAFKGVVCGNLVFEKGEGLTIGTDAFCLAKDAGAFETIRSYYDKDHIPAADGGFNIVDEVAVFYAGNCDDVSAYSAAPGWKDLNVKTWNGVTQYKYSFEIVGAKKERPIDFYEYAIYINSKPLAAAEPIDCSNKAVLKFDSPCSGDMKLEKWADGTTDPSKYEITLASDTVIRIYVEEKEHDVKIDVRNPALNDVVRLYIAEDGGEWEEKTSSKVNSCSPVAILVELADIEHYSFNGWYDGTNDDANKIGDTEEEDVYKDATLYADVTVNKYNLTVEKDIMLCPECDTQLDELIVNEETSSYSIYQSVDYNAVVSVTAKGKEGAGYRYVLDYWADDAGNFVSNENPYVFNMPGYDVRLRPVMKAAGKFAVTVKSSDDALGTVTMTPASGAETEPGSGIFWEGSKIELEAASKNIYSYFKQWNDGSNVTPHIITVRNAFDYVAEFAKDTFDITVKVEGIDAALVEVKGEGRYGYDDEVKLSYTLKDDHYTFDKWLGETYSENAEFKFNAKKTMEVSLVFKPKVYNITLVASPAEGGTVTGDATAPYKANLILKAVANEGYVFNGWEDDNEAAAERTVEVLGDATYTALFVKKTETGVEDVKAEGERTVKVLRNGMMYIIRGDKVYDALGTEIR